MIQGLRILPFGADLPIYDCSSCMNGSKKMNRRPESIEVRRRMGCGFLSRVPHADTSFGLPIAVDLGTDDDGRPMKPAHCPGYLMHLPEVQEAVRYRPHWSKGQFPSMLAGDDLTEDMEPAMDAQAILDGSITLFQNWKSEEVAKKARDEARG